MKSFERIFLYTVLAILVFYVFLIDNNAESQVAIQEEIRARSIVIVNDEGREVITLDYNPLEGEGWLYVDGSINVIDKKGNILASIDRDENNGSVMVSQIFQDDTFPVAGMYADENGGKMSVGFFVPSVIISQDSKGGGQIHVGNKDGNAVAGMIVGENDNGIIEVLNKQGDMIGSLP